MSRALRRAVPLNSRCSRKCVAPWYPGASSRLPTPTQQPSVAERTPGVLSVSTRTPPGRTLRRTSALASPATVVVVPRVSGSGTPDTSDARDGVGGRRVGRLAGSVGVGAGRRRAGPRLGGRPRSRAVALLGDDGGEAQLAARVDLLELDLDLLADREHVLDAVDPLAADQLADLGDVQQAVLAGQQADERAERRGLDHGAQEALTHLRHGRVGDGVDHRPGRLGRRAVGGADVDRAVVLDRDLGAGVVLDLVDHLALRPDDLADLVDG